LCLAASPVSAIFNNEPGGADGFKGEIVDGAERSPCNDLKDGGAIIRRAPAARLPVSRTPSADKL
jgi:hypothetical protein